MADDAPRCPLGFTGQPPAGHPNIPGLAKKTSTSAQGATSQQLPFSILPADWTLTLNPKQWSTSQTLAVDGFFLLLCVLVAVYMPAIKKQLQSSQPVAKASKAE